MVSNQKSDSKEQRNRKKITRISALILCGVMVVTTFASVFAAVAYMV